jgi:hypothetical protein
MSDTATWMAGTWVETLIYSRVLDSAESARVELYLRNRYGHY